MSEEIPPEVGPVEITSDLPSPLHSLLTELHEMYKELLKVGFTKAVATDIVSNVLIDSMQYRVSFGEDDEDFDGDDEDDEGLDLQE